MRGCGHSFHIECILPDLSVCRICESTLHAKLEVLGHTANEAVLANLSSDDQDEDTSDDEQSDDDDDNETYENQPENNANDRISTLLEQISLWKMPDVPRR